MEEFEKQEQIPSPPVITAEDTMSLEEYKEWGGKELEEKAKIEYPFYKIEGKGKTVFYFGADHSNNPADPMFEKIRSEFEEAKPDIVFVEGLMELQRNREEASRYLKNANYKEVIKEMGESGFAAKLAVENGTEVICPEPEWSSEITHLLDQSFSKGEIFVFYFYRQFNYWKMNLASERKGQDARKTFCEYIKRYLQGFQQAAGWDDFDYSPERAEQLGEEIWGGKFNFDDKDFYEDKISPDPQTKTDQKAERARINDVAAESDLFRDVYIVNKLGEMLRNHNRAFIVYGGSHAVMQRPAIKKLLGENF